MMIIARVAVHFQSITDKFSPSDAIFSYSTPAELKESALSSEIALHTAASIKSTSEPHLPEITEDEQDTTSEVTQKADCGDPKDSTGSPSGPDGAQTRPMKVTEISENVRAHERTPSTTQSLRPRTSSDTNKALPPTPAALEPEQLQSPSIYSFDARPNPSGIDSGVSSHSARPSTGDLDSAYDYKPKVKLGPRPSTDFAGRPTNSDLNGVRPVSTLPAGLYMPARKVVPGRPKSEQKQAPFLAATTPPREPPPPLLSVSPMYKASRKAYLPTSGIHTPAKTPDAKSATMTPEKRRLMKALELRQKQLAAQKLGRDNPSEKIEVGPVRMEKIDYVTLPAENQRGTAETTHLSQDLPSQSFHQQDFRQEGVLDHCPTTSQEPQDSPTSGAEASEWQSTQASSISEEESISQKPSHNSEETIKAEDERQDASLEEQFEPKILQNPVQGETFPTDNGNAKQHVEDAEEVQDPKSDGGFSLMEFGGNRQHHGSEPPVTECDKGSQNTHRAGQEKENELGQNLVITGQPRKTPIGQFLASAVSESTDHVHVGQEDSEITRSNSHAAKALGLQRDLRRQAYSVTEEPSSQSLSETHEIRPLQILAPSIDQNQCELRHDGDMPNKPSSQLILDNTNEAPAQSLAERSTAPKAPDDTPRNSLSADSRLLDFSLPTDTVSEDTRDPRHANAEQQYAPKEIVSSTDTKSEAPALTPPALHAEPRATTPSATDTVTGASGLPNVDEVPTERKVRRLGLVGSLKRSSSLESLDEQFLSDDSFMEELKTASVQEAKPISVSKSPIKPVFSRSSSEQKSPDTLRTLRSVSSPLGNHNNGKRNHSPPPLPTESASRSFSASNSPSLNPQPTLVPPTKKQIGVSSSISQRIKALEQLSTRPTSPTPQLTPQSTFISLRDRKSSLKSPTGPSDSTNYNFSVSRSSTACASPSISLEERRPDSMNRSAKTRPESISVTATIVRDVGNKPPERPLTSSEPRHTDLHQSPLVVEHQKMEPPLSPLRPPRPQYARRASTRSSSSSPNELSPTSRRTSIASKRSASSRNGSDVDLPRSASDRSLNSISGLDGIREEKNESKRSRLLKRMSSISSISRRSIASALSPGPKEASIIEHQEPVIQTSAATATDLGDVNVQFPDTLLWKRRQMLVDECWNLVLSPSSFDNNNKVTTKRFPLSDFRSPYLPDQDRQELANSTLTARVP